MIRGEHDYQTIGFSKWGVLRNLTLVAALLSLTSCAAIRNSPEWAHRVCPADQADWRLLTVPPNRADELIAAADSRLAPGRFGFSTHVFWFQKSKDALLLCSPGDSYGCGALAWEFKRVDGHWVRRDDLTTIVTCG